MYMKKERDPPSRSIYRTRGANVTRAPFASAREALALFKFDQFRAPEVRPRRTNPKFVGFIYKEKKIKKTWKVFCHSCRMLCIINELINAIETAVDFIRTFDPFLQSSLNNNKS